MTDDAQHWLDGAQAARETMQAAYQQAAALRNEVPRRPRNDFQRQCLEKVQDHLVEALNYLKGAENAERAKHGLGKPEATSNGFPVDGCTECRRLVESLNDSANVYWSSIGRHMTRVHGAVLTGDDQPEPRTDGRRLDWDDLTPDQKVRARLSGTEFAEKTLEQRVADLEDKLAVVTIMAQNAKNAAWDALGNQAPGR